jgi:DNA-binding GntR family transcriptional regulator
MLQAAITDIEHEALAPLASVNLAERVADRIVAAIAAGELKSGERLIENDLAGGLGVSRVPIREAMRVLESQGILQATPRRGMRVIAFDKAWTVQLYETRVALERQVVREAALRLRAEPVKAAKLDAVLGQMRRLVAAHDRLGVNQMDLAFHRELCELAGSPLLTSLWSAIARHVLIKFSIETEEYADLLLIFDQHAELRRLLLDGTLEDLTEEVPRHVAGTHMLLAERHRYQGKAPSEARPAGRSRSSRKD